MEKLLLAEPNPCDKCIKKEEDAYGLYCALTCDKNSIWSINNPAYRAQAKRIIEELTKPCPDHSSAIKWSKWECTNCMAGIVEQLTKELETNKKSY